MGNNLKVFIFLQFIHFIFFLRFFQIFLTDVDRPNETDLLDYYQKILWSPQVSIVSKQYALMSLAKLSTRLQPCPNELQAMIVSFSSHINVDLQQRGIEFSQLFREHAALRPALLEKMPPMQINRSLGQNGNGATPEEGSGTDLIETEHDESGLIPGVLNIINKPNAVSDSVCKNTYIRISTLITLFFFLSSTEYIA